MIYLWYTNLLDPSVDSPLGSCLIPGPHLDVWLSVEAPTLFLWTLKMEMNDRLVITWCMIFRFGFSTNRKIVEKVVNESVKIILCVGTRFLILQIYSNSNQYYPKLWNKKFSEITTQGIWISISYPFSGKTGWSAPDFFKLARHVRPGSSILLSDRRCCWTTLQSMGQLASVKHSFLAIVSFAAARHFSVARG